VFGCASLAVAQTADSCEEPVSLLQSDLQSWQRARRNALSVSKDDSCQCLNWKQSFASGLVDCGQGFEYACMGAGNYPPSPEAWLVVAQDSKHRAVLQHDEGAKGWCDSFYEVIDDNKCVRATMDRSDTEWFGKSWCYVSSACSSAMPISSPQVSVKFCQEGTDSLLSDMSPGEFVEFGRRMNFSNPEYVVKAAYPFDGTFYYADAAQHEAEVSKLKASGKTVVVDQISESRDRIIIDGGMVMRIKPAAGNFARLECVEDCFLTVGSPGT